MRLAAIFDFGLWKKNCQDFWEEHGGVRPGGGVGVQSICHELGLFILTRLMRS